MKEFICDNLSVNEAGHLCLSGVDTVALAEKHGTPLYLMDEGKIREKCRIYVEAMHEAFGADSLPLFASKAASFKQIYRIINEEGMGTDLVSSGELFTAASVGFPLSKAYFHSNNKTDFDIAYAIDNGVGYFVVDNVEELDSIDRIAGEKAVKQKILLRLTPGIDPHTYEAVATGKVDSKFGSAIETGQAEQIAKYATELENIELYGFHCHVGSQVFDSDVFLCASEIMLDFVALMKRKYNAKMAMDVIKRLREAIPGVQFTTDVIVGFPGETNEDFEETVAFIKEAQFLAAHIFQYSKRRGTPAAVMPDQVAECVKSERSAKLISIQNEITNEILKAQIGTTHNVLFETQSLGFATGHTPSFVEVRVETKLQIAGDIHSVRIIGVDNGICLGTLINNESEGTSECAKN